MSSILYLTNWPDIRLSKMLFVQSLQESPAKKKKKQTHPQLDFEKIKKDIWIEVREEFKKRLAGDSKQDLRK